MNAPSLPFAFHKQGHAEQPDEHYTLDEETCDEEHESMHNSIYFDN